MATHEFSDSAWIKLDLLAQGIQIDDSALQYFRSKKSIAYRKNFYNTPVWLGGKTEVPQELRVLKNIVGVNVYGPSAWCLYYDPDIAELILENKSKKLRYQPELISDLKVFAENPGARRTANLYGGAALAFFSPRTCYFFSDGTECGFCSLQGTAEESSEFQGSLSEVDVGRAVSAALQTDPTRLEQIMIVGGNMRDLDRGFLHHVSLARSAAKAIEASGVRDSISIHIATMPPRDLNLLSHLRDFQNVHVMFNLEVWDIDLFAVISPGKERDYGRSTMLRALESLRDVVGGYRAHSLLIAGLEPPESTTVGAMTLASMGISPIINVYHSDRHSRLGLTGRPGFDELAQVARGLDELYRKYPVEPYWRSCGRNAIDAEAKEGQFASMVPSFLLKNSTQ